MTRLSFIALTIFLVLLLTACGSTPTPVTTSMAATSAATAPARTLPTSTAQPTTEPTTMSPPEPSPTSAATETAQTSAAGSEATEQIAIKLFMFKPNALDVKAGTTIVWTNEDEIDHSVTAGTPGTPGGAFDSDFFTQGETFTFTFEQPGEYPYFCKRHESMTGTINVTAP